MGFNIPGCFMEISTVFQECFKEVSRKGKFQRSSKKVLRCFKKVSWVLQGNLECVSRVFHTGFKKVSKVTLSRFKGSFKRVSRIFHRSFEEVSRKC